MIDFDRTYRIFQQCRLFLLTYKEFSESNWKATMNTIEGPTQWRIVTRASFTRQASASVDVECTSAQSKYAHCTICADIT